MLGVEVVERLLVGVRAGGRCLRGDLSHLVRHGREQPVAVLAQRAFGLELGGHAAPEFVHRHLRAEIRQVDAAFGRHGVAVALGHDQDARAVGRRDPHVLGRDGPDGVVVEQARSAEARASGSGLVQEGSAMPRLADHRDEPVAGQELRQDVVLDVPRHADLVLAVAPDEIDLPVLLRHHLERHAPAVRRDGRRVEALHALVKFQGSSEVVGRGQ